MTKTRTLAVALSLCAAVACSEQGPMPTSPASPSSLEGTNAKPGGPPAGDVAVTSTIQPGLDIAGVGGPYTNSTTDKSIIQSSNGVWYLGSAPRTVSLRFDSTPVTGNAIPGTGPNNGPPVSPGSGNYQVFMYTACNFPNYGNISLLTMPAGTPTPCPMAVQFETGGKKYILRMNSFQDSGTDDVKITRLVGGTTWQILPSALSGSNIARLSYQGKGNAGLVPQGDYYMSFSIDLTNP